MSSEAVPDKGKVPPPYPLALIICDGLHRDPGTKKVFLLGCFSTVIARSFPTVHPVMYLYCALTDGRGKVPVRIKLVDADEERSPIWEETFESEFADPRSVNETYWQILNTTFPEPGEYRFQVFAAGEFLMERRIMVIAHPKGQENEPS